MEKTAQFWRKDSGIELDDNYEKTSFFDLPAEIRSTIWELVFDPEESYNAAFAPNPKEEEEGGGTAEYLHEDYWASEYLQPLLTCHDFYNDANLLAFSRTTFAVRNPYTALDMPGRLTSRLRPDQISSLRSIAVVSETRHFRQMHHWKSHAFGVPALHLNELTIILHRSSYWHYLFDFNTTMTRLLRDFQGVRKLKFVRNKALVKPHFHTWFNRFVSLVLSTDRSERFCCSSSSLVPKPEKSWWNWDFDARAQTATFFRLPVKPEVMGVEEYDAVMLPVVEWLKRSIENEEFDSDPMSRNGFA